METETGNGVGAPVPVPVSRKARGKLTEQHKALLGTMPDGELAKLAGVTYPAVYMARSKLGIPQFGKGATDAAPQAKPTVVKAKLSRGPKAAPAVKTKRKGSKAKAAVATTPIVLPTKPAEISPSVDPVAPFDHSNWAAELLLKLAGSKEYAIQLIRKLKDPE